ncbi:hypothetical protein Tco_1194399 [Tanacetum coccineum]
MSSLFCWAERLEKFISPPMEFEVGDNVMLSFDLGKGLVGDVAYKLELPEELSRVHNTFHVSNLKKCHADEPLAVLLDGLHFDDKLQLCGNDSDLRSLEVKRSIQEEISTPLHQDCTVIKCRVISLEDKAHLTGGDYNTSYFRTKYSPPPHERKGADRITASTSSNLVESESKFGGTQSANLQNWTSLKTFMDDAYQRRDRLGSRSMSTASLGQWRFPSEKSSKFGSRTSQRN